MPLGSTLVMEASSSLTDKKRHSRVIMSGYRVTDTAEQQEMRGQILLVLFYENSMNGEYVIIYNLP